METIVKNEIGAAVGDLDWDSIINTAITTTPDIITAANSGGNNNNSNNNNGNGSTIVGGNPSTYSPGTTQLKTTSKGMQDYLPWILGGAAVLLLFMVMSQNKSKK